MINFIIYIIIVVIIIVNNIIYLLFLFQKNIFYLFTLNIVLVLPEQLH